MGRHGTIAGRKAAQDSKRAAMFTKYTRAIIVAAKAGGDPDYNATLRVAIEKAKGIGMPNDNIKRAIKKGTGELEGESYEELSFEGYGVGGVAVIVETLTDNRNRTTSAVRSIFDKNGGNLGTPGCVSYMFSRKGVIIIEKTDDIDEDALMEAALDAGAEDMITHDDSYEIITAPENYTDVSYEPDCFIMFGNESRGIPEEILLEHPDTCIRIPMWDASRSLNLANSVAIILYEALRQQGFPGFQMTGELHRLHW